MMNRNLHTSPSNIPREIIRLLIITIPSVFVLQFIWFGLVILIDKEGIGISAERLLLGMAALMMGGLWAWLSLKGKMPFGYATPKLTTAQNPIQKLMRGLFVIAGMAAYVALAMMPEPMVYAFFRFLSFGPILDTLGLLVLFAMVLLIVIDSLITTIKHKLMPHQKPKENIRYINWYLFAMINWVVLLIMIVGFLLMVYGYWVPIFMDNKTIIP